jgi:hypothetical protein
MGGMDDNQRNRLRQLADSINVSIRRAISEVIESDDETTKALIAQSLTDLQRAWLILDKRLRKK